TGAWLARQGKAYDPIMGLRRFSLLTLPALACLPGCTKDDPSGGMETSPITVGPTTADPTTTGGVDGTATTSGASVDGPELSSCGGSSSTGNGIGGIFDVGTIADVGDGPEVELTCDNIDEVTATSVGCEFYAVDLAMLTSNEMAYGVSVGNPGSVVANVVI